MASILLLYDTKQKDLARDFNDLLEEFNLGSIIMIPLSPDKGLTLEKKEEQYFESADGAIFIITPGSERFGMLYPSPSVAHEMGQAKQKFKMKPESVIYLVDENCNQPAIDQKSYIAFNPTNIRSTLSALTQLVKNLKVAGLFRTTPIPAQTATLPKINIPELAKNMGAQKVSVLFNISNKLDGAISDSDLTKLLGTEYSMSVQDINFIKRDLKSFGVVIQNITSTPYYSNYWWLNNLGWDIVRYEAERKKKSDQDSMEALLKMLGGLNV